MALLKIYTFPDPVLRQTAEPIKEFDADLEQLANDMLETMYDAPGVGLAANQVGILKRILVLDVKYSIEGESEQDRVYKDKEPLVIINPEIKEKSGKTLYREGCLSVPGFTEEVKRFSEIELKYCDVKGNEKSLQADGLLAIAIQHEIDHLDGKLFIDRLSAIKKSMIKGKIKKERNAKFERSKFQVEL